MITKSVKLLAKCTSAFYHAKMSQTIIDQVQGYLTLIMSQRGQKEMQAEQLAKMDEVARSICFVCSLTTKVAGPSEMHENLPELIIMAQEKYQDAIQKQLDSFSVNIDDIESIRGMFEAEKHKNQPQLGATEDLRVPFECQFQIDGDNRVNLQYEPHTRRCIVSKHV